MNEKSTIEQNQKPLLNIHFSDSENSLEFTLQCLRGRSWDVQHKIDISLERLTQRHILFGSAELTPTLRVGYSNFKTVSETIQISHQVLLGTLSKTTNK